MYRLGSPDLSCILSTLNRLKNVISLNLKLIEELKNVKTPPAEIIQREKKLLKNIEMTYPTILNEVTTCKNCFEIQDRICNVYCLNCRKCLNERKYFDYESCIDAFQKLLSKLNSYCNFCCNEELKILSFIKTFLDNPTTENFSRCCYLNANFGLNGLSKKQLKFYPINPKTRLHFNSSTNEKFRYFVKNFIPLKLRKSSIYVLMLWNLMYGIKIQFEDELLVSLFRNYLGFCHDTGTYRVTDKYKFIIFIHLIDANTPTPPFYSDFTTKEKKSLLDWKNYLFLNFSY